MSKLSASVVSTLQGFKNFIMRGNVIDLSVGIVIGAAFTDVVTNFTGAFIEPLIRVISGGGGEVSGSFRLRGVLFDYATAINALIAFLITAAVLYFLVVTPVNRFVRRKEADPAPAEEIMLLREIRDELVRARGESTSIPRQG